MALICKNGVKVRVRDKIRVSISSLYTVQIRAKFLHKGQLQIRA